MRNLPVGLGLVIGVVVGLTVGYYFGSDSPPLTVAAAVAPTSNAVAERPLTDDIHQASDFHSADREWFEGYQTRLKQALPGQPTPHIAETIGDALKADPPLDTARVLMLIQTMRKEDFPVALKLFRTAKSNINYAFQNPNGPIAWTAFWQEFGAIDPRTALASALECRDLNYNGRQLLEKHLFTGLARNNPEAAAQMLLSTPDLPNLPVAVEGLAFEWGKTNPAAAIAWSQQNLTDRALEKASFAVVWGASNWGDISGGNSVLKTIPSGQMRASALRSLKQQITDKPNLPTEQVIEFMTITRALQEYDPAFEKQQAARCALRDPIGAANFYAQPLDNNQPADYANLRTVLDLWNQRDPAGAKSWAKGQKGKPHFADVIAVLHLDEAQ